MDGSIVVVVIIIVIVVVVAKVPSPQEQWCGTDGAPLEAHDRLSAKLAQLSWEFWSEQGVSMTPLL